MNQPNRTRTSTRRPDIQALRAIAVLLVILDHMALLQRLPGHPEGGFIGVDIFFVISGFLITGTLIRQAVSTGRISYREFYTRRARRILPMAALTAAASIAASFLVFWPGRAFSSLIDGFWSMLFVANVHFALENTDYFAQTTPSIVQHYWSLSVEEQFYVVWPILIAVTVYAAKRLKRRTGPLLVAMMVIVGLASFVWACYASIESPSSAYFSTFTRGFELIMGGLVALSAKNLRMMPQRLRLVLSFGGLCGLSASVFIVTPSGGFPGPLALLPAIFAAIFIAAGTGTDRRVAVWPLNCKTVTYVGDISYSLYLWHWPVIVLLGVLIPPNSVVSMALVATATSALAAASYRWVEQPVLNSNWLLPNAARKPLSKARPIALVGLMTASLLTVSAAFAGGALFVQRGDSAAGISIDAETTVTTAAEVRSLQDEMSQATDRNTWSNLTPSIETAAEIVSGVLTDDCWNERNTVRRHCVIGPTDATNTVVVFGDSMAMNWVPGLWAAIKNKPGWNLSIYAKVGCPFADVPVLDTDGSMYKNCTEFREWAVGEINAEGPATLVLASALKKTLPGATTEDIPALWGEGVARTLSQIGHESPVILTAPPEGAALISCANRFSTPAMCESFNTLFRAATNESTVRAATNAHVIDVGLWFCRPDGSCPPVIGTIPVRRDTVHMTDAYSERLAPLLSGFLFPAP